MQRIFWLDFSRAIAIILVVFTHIHERIGVNDYLLAKSLFYSVDRMGVPLFFMLSGGLMLPKLVNVNLVDFYKKRIPKFFIVLILFSLITTWVNVSLEIKQFYLGLDLFTQSNGIYPALNGHSPQFWYMYVIIELYLIYPFLAKMLDKLSNKEIIWFIFMSVLFSQFKFSINYFDHQTAYLLERFGDNFVGWAMAYSLIGYLILNRQLKLNLIFSLCCIIVPISLVTWCDLHSNTKDIIGEFHWYSQSIFIFISSLGLVFISQFLGEKIKENRLISNISRYSFGIYLSHAIFIPISLWLEQVFNLELSIWLKLSLSFMVTFVLSYLFTALLMKIKWGRSLVG